MAISFVSLSARSWRPPFVNCSTDSRRCLTSVCSTCIDSASSSGRTFSISLYLSADLTMRSTLRRNSSLDIIASVRSFWMRSISAIWLSTNEGSCSSLVLGIVCLKRKISLAEFTISQRLLSSLHDAHRTQPRDSPREPGLMHHVHDRVHVLVRLGNFLEDAVACFRTQNDAAVRELLGFNPG